MVFPTGTPHSTGCKAMSHFKIREIKQTLQRTRSGHQVLDLQVNSGEFIVIVGPSGCGKSTLLA